MDDALRIGIVGGLMTLLLLMGLALRPSGSDAEEPLPVVEAVAVEEVECTVLQDLTLEMLDPVYSEKAVYDDGVIRASFDIRQNSDGVESGLALWLHNSSPSAMIVHWDRCSFQLPDSDTVNAVHDDEAGPLGEMIPEMLTLAPGADLFTTVYPVTEVEMDAGWVASTGVFSEGPFQFVLAVEDASGMCALPSSLQYYAFRFIVR